MFQRIYYEAWAHYVPFISFSLTFGAFLIFSLKASFLKKQKRDTLASLPLETEATEKSLDHE